MPDSTSKWKSDGKYCDKSCAYLYNNEIGDLEWKSCSFFNAVLEPVDDITDVLRCERCLKLDGNKYINDMINYTNHTGREINKGELL